VPRMAVLTPSYGPDLIAALTLHDSVLRHTGPDVIHHVVVPEEDRKRFEEHRSERLVVHSTREFIPDRYQSVYPLARRVGRWSALRRLAKVQAVDIRHPWPPLRGWMIQQLVKLAAPAVIDADVTVSIDSDSALIRMVGVETFISPAGQPLIHALPGGVTKDMDQHRGWLDTAGRLIGLPPVQPPWTDYITPIVAWHGDLVRALIARVSEATGRKDWREAVASLPTFSECMLYGRYVLEYLPAGTVIPVARPTSLTYWPNRPLLDNEVPGLLKAMTGRELAITIQSVSGTDPAVRARAIGLAEQRVAQPPGAGAPYPSPSWSPG
jgi:hypothetical protein